MGRVLDPQKDAHDDGCERLYEAAQESAIRVHLVQIAPQLLQALEVLGACVDVERGSAVSRERKHHIGGDGVCHLAGTRSTLKQHPAEWRLRCSPVGDEEILV